jgi:DNA repair protein RecO (recombination protein O)
MALCRTRAVVTGRRALGESDRLVEFFTRDFGKVHGVAKAARRPRSRFGAALELLTLGDLVFFDTGRSELVRVDHFDIVYPFVKVREDLERLGRGAWAVECLSRLSAERDPNAALFGLLVRSLRALEAGVRPGRVAMCFGARAVDLLGHRPRLDGCVRCARAYPFPDAGLDMDAGGLVCGPCARGGHALAVAEAAVRALVRLRGLGWEAALRLPLPPRLDDELTAVLEGVVTRLVGQVPRSIRFLTQTRRPRPPVLS